MTEATLGVGALHRGAAGARPKEAVDIERLVGAVGWARLAPAIRRRFARGHAATPVLYVGRMAFRRSAVGLAFALAGLALRGPLPLRRAEDCPVTVAVSGDGRGGVVWERCVRFPGASAGRCIQSTKRMGPEGTLLECVRGGLGMVLDVYEEEGALVFASRRYFLAVGGVRLPLPRLIDPGRCVVTHSEVTDGDGDSSQAGGRFRFTLEMRHRLWGRTFFQTGVFVDPVSDPEG